MIINNNLRIVFCNLAVLLIPSEFRYAPIINAMSAHASLTTTIRLSEAVRECMEAPCAHHVRERLDSGWFCLPRGS